MIRSKTGLVIDPYFSGTKVKWMLDNNPACASAPSAARSASAPSIPGWSTGSPAARVHITDYSNASRTMLYNIRELRWDEELLELLDIPAAMLPEVRPSSHVYGETDPQMFFGTHGIPVAGIAGDQQAALFGQAAT
jgi:glycerol kinase